MSLATHGSMTNRGGHVTGPIRGSDLGWVNTVCASTNLPNSNTSNPSTHRSSGCETSNRMLSAHGMLYALKRTVRNARRSWSGSVSSFRRVNGWKALVLSQIQLNLVPIAANESETDERHSKNTLWRRARNTVCRTLCTLKHLSPCFSSVSVAHNVLWSVQVFENEKLFRWGEGLKILVSAVQFRPRHPPSLI
jgi:hypothetical protein